MYHVFYDSQKLVVVNTGNPNSVKELELILIQHGWQGQNWYGTHAKSKKDAILEAESVNFKDVSPKEIAAKLKKVDDLRSRVQKFNHDQKSKHHPLS